MKIMIFGPPGSGKGTQTELLVKKFNLPRIVTGDIVREKAKTSKEIADLLASGRFAPESMINEFVKERLESKDCQNGYILDGYPRNITQAKFLNDMGVKLDAMIILKVADEVIIDRLSGRMIHEGSGRIYNIHSNPPKEEGKDDITGEPLIIRADDRPKSIKNRLDVYRKQTEPVIDYYRNTDTKIIELDGDQKPKVVFEQLLEQLGG